MPLVSPKTLILLSDGWHKLGSIIGQEVCVYDGERFVPRVITLDDPQWGCVVMTHNGFNLIGHTSNKIATFKWDYPLHDYGGRPLHFDKSVKFIDAFDKIAMPVTLACHSEIIPPYLPYQSGIMVGRRSTFNEVERFGVLKRDSPFTKRYAFLRGDFGLVEALRSIGERVVDCKKYKSKRYKYYTWNINLNYNAYHIPLFGNLDYAIEWLSGVIDFLCNPISPTNIEFSAYRQWLAKIIYLVGLRCGYLFKMNPYYDEGKNFDLLRATKIYVPREFMRSVADNCYFEYGKPFPRIMKCLELRGYDYTPVLGEPYPYMAERITKVEMTKFKGHMARIDGPCMLNGLFVE